METIGFIGLGIMGRPMALNLIKAGYSLRVHARRAFMMEPLLEKGATACASPREVAEQSDIIITMVADTPDVETVILGEDGLVEALRPGSVVVDMSTISPIATRRLAEKLAERDIAMLDAPVSGGEQGAIDGALSIMIGGKADTYQRLLPVFGILGKNIVHIGDHGAGQVAKACNQLIVAQAIAAVGEAYILASAAGVDADRVREALLGGFAASRVLESHGQRMLDENYKAGFKARLHRKDLAIALEAAHEFGIVLPGTSLVTGYLDATVNKGYGEDDSISLFKIQQQFTTTSADS
jgi:2-hydroxy-3-oxopropionate reductase